HVAVEKIDVAHKTGVEERCLICRGLAAADQRAATRGSIFLELFAQRIEMDPQNTPPAGSGHLSCSATLSSPAWTHGSSTPGEPETPTPAMTSSPSLTGNPPGMAITFGKVTCWWTTGSLSAKRLA